MGQCGEVEEVSLLGWCGQIDGPSFVLSSPWCGSIIVGQMQLLNHHELLVVGGRLGIFWDWLIHCVGDDSCGEGNWWAWPMVDRPFAVGSGNIGVEWVFLIV